MASYITERTFGQIPMSAQIVVPEDLAPVLKAVTEIPSAEESQENDIVQLIREQPGYIAGRYYQYLKNTDTGEYSWVDISTNIPTGKQAGVGVYVHVGSRVFLMWVDPPGMFSNMRQITAAEIANGPSPLIQYYVIVDISPEDQPGTAYGYTLAGENGFISAFEEGVNYYVECEANEWVRAEVYLADVNGIIIEGESALISSDIQNEYAVDGCGVTNPRLNVAHLSETYKFILREYFADGSYVDNSIQPMQLQANANTLFYQSDWKDHNPLSIAYIRGKPLLIRKLLINKDGDLIAYADDENTLKHLYIDDDGNLIYEYSDDEEEIDGEASDGSNKTILNEDDVMPANASLGDIRKLMKTLWSRAGGKVKALVAAACLFGGSSYAAEPGTTTDEHIYDYTPIVTNAWQAVEPKVAHLLRFYDCDYGVRIGPAAFSQYFQPTSILLDGSPKYPSSVGEGFSGTDQGSFNISIGFDNKVGYATGTPRYAVAIGTSAKAKYMHSYAWGSQINALAQNSTVVGYGLTALDQWSTVVGHGKRPVADLAFTSVSDMYSYFSNNTNPMFVGQTVIIANQVGMGADYIVRSVLSEPDIHTGLYVTLEMYPMDYEYANKGWKYGKTHGKGTFNIVAVNPEESRSRGLRAVYINDDSLYDLVVDASGGQVTKHGPELTQAQINKGITYVSNGYKEDGAVEIGVDASSQVSSNDVKTLNKANTKIRNVGIAIGTRAVAEGSSSTKNQSIAIGYSAHAKGSCATAIGPGAKHFDDEDDETGHNAYANGSTALAIGYATKAKGTATTAIGAGVSGGKKTIASADRACAIGQAAQSTAPGAFQLGTGLNTTPNSLQFMNTTIVKDGKVVGGFDPAELDPKEVFVSSTNYEVTVKAHTMTTLTISDTKSTYPEIEINPETTRNYEIFLDNTAENRMQLPLILTDEGRGLFIGKSEQKIFRVPVCIKVKEPRKDRVLVDVEYIDDGYEWNPVITNMTANVSADGEFAVENLTGRGTELHFLTDACLKLTYGSTVVEHSINVSSALYNQIMCDTFRTNSIPTSVMYIGTGNGFRVEKPITW